MQRYHVSPKTREEGMTEKDWMVKVVRPISLRCSNIIKKWIESSFDDYCDDYEVVQKIRNFVDTTLKLDNQQKISAYLINFLDKKVNFFKVRKKKKCDLKFIKLIGIW